MSAPDREAEALINYLCEEAEHEVECAGEFTELAKQLRALEVTARRLARESIANKQPTDAEVMAHPKVKALLEAAGELSSIVEGIQGTFNHGAWRDEKNAMRLKDTSEWVTFYDALAAIQEAKP